MAKKWSGVKSKIKDRDLDAEFEKFLNESLSDESLASPRRSITPRGSSAKARLASTAPAATRSGGAGGKQKFDLPWWATSEDEEASKSEAAKKQWLKKRKSEESIEDGVDDVDSADGASFTPKQQTNPLTISRDSLDANTSRPGTALDTIMSESEPSYSEPVISAKKSEEDLIDEQQGEDGVDDNNDDDNDDDYGGDSFTGTKTSSSSSQVSVTMTGSTPTMQPGMETLEEIKEKELFFSKLEEKAEGVDYGKLTDQLADEHSDVDGGEGADVLGLQAYHPPPHSDDETASSHDETTARRYHEKSHSDEDVTRNRAQTDDDELHSSSYDARRVGSDDGQVSNQSESESESDESAKTEHKQEQDHKQEAPSLLSKVALMESLDSTAGLNLADKLSKLNTQLAAKQSSSVRMQSSLVRVGGAEVENQTTSNEDQLGKTADTTVDFAEALSNIKKLSTQSFGQSDDRFNIFKDIGGLAPQATPSGGLLLDKDDVANIKVNEFDLKPIISNFTEEPKIAAASAGFLDNSMGSTLAVTRSQLNKVQTFSDMNELIATALVDDYIKQVDSSAQPTVKTPAHSWSPSVPDNDNMGFSLEPISAVLESDRDSPPTDSLKSIKSIAEEKKKRLLEKSKKSQRDIRTAPAAHRLTSKPKTPRKRTNIPSIQKTKSTVKVPQSHNKKTQELTKSKPPRPSSQKSPPKRRPATAKEHSHGPEIMSDDLLASIEMLSASLQEFRHDADKTDVVLNSTLLETSRDKATHLSALQREQHLQDELRDLRQQYGDLLRDYEKLQQQFSAQQHERSQEKEGSLLEHGRVVKDLREELFVLKNKLEMSEKERKKALDLKVRQFTELSQEDVEHLQKQLHQQESLLNGYQQENERLYKELKDKGNDMKKIESKMFEQNQKLASEVGNLKEKLDNRPAVSSISSSATLSATRIAQLENQIKFYKGREDEHKAQILNLENEVLLFKKKLNQSEKQKGVPVVTDEGLLKQFEEMKSARALEVDKLNKKLKWYGENQELLDKDAAALKDKREEVKELREVIERLENENKKMRREKTLNQSSKNSDNTKILDLKRQVKEMEDIIRRRHPNSLPALIYAASAVPGENKVYDSLDAAQNKNVNAYLEKRVKTLEEELEERDAESGKKVRAIEQQYNSMSQRYEEHVKQLEEKINELSLRNMSPKKTIDAEDELSRQQSEYEEIIENLKEKLKERQSKILLKELEIEKMKGDYTSKPQHPQQAKKEISRLKSKLKTKDTELEELRSTLYVLQRERENLLAGDDKQDSESSSDVLLKRSSPHLIDHATSPLGKVESLDRCLHLEKENNKLRIRLEEFQLETKEKILRLEASEACALSEKRKLDEQLREQLRLTEETNAREIEKMKMQFAVEHSNSKVAELNGKAKSYEMMIEHLKQRLDETKGDREKVTQAKLVEDTLRKEIIQIQDELHEARKHFTPEMHHYKLLQAKVASMETRHFTREQELELLLDKARSKSAADLSYAEDKWRELLREKDIEITRFRDELDAIIEVLRELKRQGIILPVSDTQHVMW